MDAQKKSRCLQDLPNELLLKILGYLSCNFRLASVTRVCHHFKDLIDSIEMKSLDLKVIFAEKEILKMKRSARKKHPLHKLLRKFVQQPTGQTHTSWLPPSYDRFRRLFEHLEYHPKMLKEIRSVSLSVQDRSWYTSCGQHDRLLHSFPYLDHLTLSPPPPISSRFPVQTPHYGPRALKSLRLDYLPLTAPLYCGDVREDILNVIDHYRYWLGLHKLRIDGLECINVLLVNEGMTSIRDLWCVGCRKCEAVVSTTQLIRSSTGLVRYVFETDTERFPYRPFPPQNPFFLFDGLLMHKRTLRQLVIASSSSGAICEDWRVGRLDTFCQLEKLAIPCFMLPKSTLNKADYEMLPPKLEELQLEYPSEWGPTRFGNEHTLEMFRSGAGQMKFRLPYLKRLIMWDRWNPIEIADSFSGLPDCASREKLQALEQTFKEIGVKFEWLSVSSFWDTPVGKALDAEGDVIIEKSRGGERDPITLHPTSPMV